MCVTRQKYPLEITLGGTGQHGHGVIHPTLPGHVLTLLPPVTLLNLLPLELHYYLKGTGVSGNLKAGKQAALHGVGPSSMLDFNIATVLFSQYLKI